MKKNPSQEQPIVVNIKVLAGQVVVLLLFFTLPLFLSAGTLTWSAGWIFLLMFFTFTVALILWLLRHNPSLLKERMTAYRPDQFVWDKVFGLVTGIFFITWLILMPLDAVRFRWSHVPLWLQIGGAMILLCSFILFFLTFRENSYLSSMVRIQEDRGHTVISTGPYHYVRHPMYAAFLFFIPGTALLLGSAGGLLFGLIFVGIIARRAVLEERVLQEGLQGYDDYMAHVKYRFIPSIW